MPVLDPFTNMQSCIGLDFPHGIAPLAEPWNLFMIPKVLPLW